MIWYKNAIMGIIFWFFVVFHICFMWVKHKALNKPSPSHHRMSISVRLFHHSQWILFMALFYVNIHNNMGVSGIYRILGSLHCIYIYIHTYDLDPLDLCDWIIDIIYIYTYISLGLTWGFSWYELISTYFHWFIYHYISVLGILTTIWLCAKNSVDLSVIYVIWCVL